MKKKLIYMLVGIAMLSPLNGNSAESSPPTPPVKNPRDTFLPDIDFSGKVYQVTANPIVWNDDRSLAVIWEDTGASCMCYTFWCLKRNAQGKMAPIAKYTIWTDLLKKGILLDEKGLTVMLEGTRGLPGKTSISQYFPFTIPQAQISFLQKTREHQKDMEQDDLEKEWKRFLER